MMTCMENFKNGEGDTDLFGTDAFKCFGWLFYLGLDTADDALRKSVGLVWRLLVVGMFFGGDR